MRTKLVLLFFIFSVTVCDNSYINETLENPKNKLIADKKLRQKYEVTNEDGSISNHRHLHERSRLKKNRNKGRCKRYAQQFYKPFQRVPAYVPERGEVYLPPNYVPPSYLVPAYNPTRCATYCVPCPSSSCRRRCPVPVPIRTTDIPRTTPRTRVTSPRTRATSPRTRATSPKTSITTYHPTSQKGAVPFATIRILPKFPCNCDQDGSIFFMCNVTTGECKCKQHYTGISCNICEDNFWKNEKECVPCKCNEYGSVKNTICNKDTGQCQCKSGITGNNCDICLPDHYGTIQSACKKCDPCDRKGHICDPNNGKCVCPPLTKGNDCQVCTESAWGYEPGIGCKACNCSEFGSKKVQCDKTHGKCQCKNGYEGEKCEKCSFGYFGYPNCKKCTCDPKGTEETECQNGLCRCSENGLCKCKENVHGSKCDKCKKNHYGLTQESTKGCTECFCFNRSSTCDDAHYNWDKIRMEKDIEETNSIDEINDVLMLPADFMGDLTLSYGGYLSISVPNGSSYVYLEGNGVTLYAVVKNELQMVESNWKVVSGNSNFPPNCQDVLNRACFMVVLQRVSKFRVQAQGRISEVLLDTAKSNMPTYTLTHSIEKCRCPEEYTGLSCQDPNNGYYRYFPKIMEDQWLNVVVGIAKPCECNGKSSQCDRDTGSCKNCSSHTTGDHCELCNAGYFMDKDKKCSSCLCPSAEQNNAESCSPTNKGFLCNCKQGYKGTFCDECDVGFFNKDRSKQNLVCEPCNCHPYGTIPQSQNYCNNDGICRCREGFTGDKCNKCSTGREYIKDGICSPCDECAQLLFDQIDELEEAVNTTFGLFKDGLAPPWKILTDNLNKHKLLSEKFKTIKEKTDHLLNEANLTYFENKVNTMKNDLAAHNEVADSNLVKVDKLYDNSTKLIQETDALGKELITIIENLDNFGNEKISLEEALEKARKIQKDIRQISNWINSLDDKKTYAFCSNISEKINKIYALSPTIPHDSLKQLKNRLNDLIDTTAYIETISQLAEKINSNNSKRLKVLKDKINKMKNEGENISNSIQQIMSKIKAINDMIDKLQIIYNDLEDIANFDEEYEKLENRIKREMEISPEIDELYIRAVEHVKELEDKVEQYRSIFNFTKEEWKKINASGAYEALINGINEARKNSKIAEEILANATQLIDPEKSDNLMDKTNLAHAYSDRLKQRINNFKDISKDLSNIKNKLDDLKYAILENGKSNNDLTHILYRMETEITSQANKVAKLGEAIDNSTDVSEEMRATETTVNRILFDKQRIFFKEYEIFLNLTSTVEINNLTNNLKHIREKLQNLNITSTHLDTVKNLNNINKNHNISSIHDKIKGLQNKIIVARQAADMIHIPMNLSNCLMSYQIKKREIFQSLSLTYQCKSCNLLKWIKKEDHVIEMVVENYQLEIRIDNKVIPVISDNSDDIERTVIVRKIGSIFKIFLDDIEKKTEIMDSVYNVISLTDKIEVGNTTTSNNGYIYKILLNDQNIGVWNFKTTSGNCKGQKRGKTNNGSGANLVTYFKGEGYRVYGVNKLNAGKLNWRFELTTFDENCLIYLASTDNCKQYIAIYLENGVATFTVYHDATNTKTIISTAKLNDGKKHKIEVIMQYAEGKQYYRIKNDKEEDISQSIMLPNSKVIKIRSANHYIGGIPRSFDRSCGINNTTSFLGFLTFEPPLTNDKESYGFRDIPEKVLDFFSAWVNKNGYLKLNYSNLAINTLNFILKPNRTNGIIFKFNPQDSINIKNYQLFITIGENSYTSTNVLNNDYNFISLTFGNHRTLTINSKKEETPFVNAIGVNKFITIGNLDKGFDGGIQNIVVNNESILFNYSSIVEFSNVEIGRDKDLPQNTGNDITTKSLTINPNFTNSMQNTERCAPFGNYLTDPGAIKYGDKPNSYTYIKSNFWKSDFTLTFEFRSFYSNGIIFIACNKQLQSYIFFELKEGKINLIIKGKKKIVMINYDKKINDGNWHNIEINKKKRKLSIQMDDEKKKSVKIPKSNVRDEIYLGGLPTNSEYMRIRDLKDKLLPFRGCMKSLVINGDPKFLMKNNKDVSHSNIRQCFPSVEQGAYFGGDAFAIYKESYQVNKILELSFEFRTAEQNGILLSVSNFRNSPALSVELQNGAVVMAVDMGNGVLSKATNNLDSDFALCNNQWHNVTALYSSSELTVNVDGIRKSWVQSEINSMIDEIEAPLYIGGLPDDAPVGTLKSRENFKGCIRKFKIEDKLMDWSDMKELNNVLLNSCPVMPQDNNTDSHES